MKGPGRKTKRRNAEYSSSSTSDKIFWNLTSGAIQNGVPTEVFRRRRVLVSWADTPGRMRGSYHQSSGYFHPRQPFWRVTSSSCHATTSSACASQIHLSSSLDREAQSWKVLSTSAEVLRILVSSGFSRTRTWSQMSIWLVIWLHIFWLVNYRFSISCFKRAVKDFREGGKVLYLPQLPMLSTDTKPLFHFLYIYTYICMHIYMSC